MSALGVLAHGRGLEWDNLQGNNAMVMVKVELKAERNESTLEVFEVFNSQLRGKKRNKGSEKGSVGWG